MSRDDLAVTSSSRWFSLRGDFFVSFRQGGSVFPMRQCLSAALILVLSLTTLVLRGGDNGGAQFIRGDADGNGTVDQDDVTFLIERLEGDNNPDLPAEEGFPCPDSADVDDDGQLTDKDAVFLLKFLTEDGAPPPAPFPECGLDETRDRFSRCDYRACEAISQFIRGDSNGSGDFDITDAITVLNFLFIGGSRPPCFAAADLNGNQQVDLSDAVYALNTLFLGGPNPSAPYPNCGPNPCEGDDCLDCETEPFACES
ncbi:MAG: hypothetical protein AAF517_04405 [Planctomycetota bacterium]